MGEVVNLRRARKRQARDADAANAAANRAKYGRTAAERMTTGREKAAAERQQEGHRLDRDK